MKIAVPDLVSNSYFPVVAAVELGYFREQGIEAGIELVSPVDKAYAALKSGAVDFVGGSAHSAVSAFADWDGVKLLCAQAQGMYWFLVMHADHDVHRGDINAVKGRKIGAAPWVELGLRRLLMAAGIDLARDRVDVAPVPNRSGIGVNFGLNAARALEARQIDGFWANGMGAEVALSRGIGTVVLDVRRGDGPGAGFNYTMASLATTDRLIESNPAAAELAIRAVVKAQAALRRDVSLARKVADKVFQASEAALIEKLIQHDLPYYDASISRDFIAGMSQFSLDMAITTRELDYRSVVAERFSHLWKS
jgi:ABC-type nitrate/sulfonate/bicarbonate transport system substrate-binding protein